MGSSTSLTQSEWRSKATRSTCLLLWCMRNERSRRPRGSARAAALLRKKQFTTRYLGGALRRRGAMRKSSSTAQPRQGRGRTATPMRTTASWPRRSGPLGLLKPSARPQRGGGGGGGCARAFALYAPTPSKTGTTPFFAGSWHTGCISSK
jgi:hypothetical protein